MRPCVGGPYAGELMDSTADVVELAAHPGMAYHWTQDHRLPDPDPDWWMKGLPEPQPRPRVYEWHERHWQAPEILVIRDAIDAAERKVFGP